MKRTILYMVFLILARTPAFPAEDRAVPEKFRLTGVRFIGVKSVSRKDLHETLAARLPVRWKVWTPRPVLARTDLDEDLVRIQQFYQQKGYYHTEAAYTVAVSEPGGSGADAGKDVPETDVLPGVAVTYRVSEGPPVLIETIDIQVQKPVDAIDESRLADALPIRTGKIFGVDDYESAKKELSKIYGNQGYAFAGVTGKVIVDPEANTARITLQIDPGTRYRFGDIRIKDDEGVVKDIVIRRSLRFEPGEPYNSRKIAQSQRNLFNLDVFRLALVNTGEPEPGSDRLPMEVQVKPKKRNSVRAGIGYGNEDGLRLSGGWTYRNLFGWAGKVSIDAKHSDLIDVVEGRYVQPYFLGEKNTLQSDAGFEREKLDSYNSLKIFANAYFDRKLGDIWSGRAGYRLDVSDIQDLKITVSEEIARAQEENRFFISSALLGLTRNTVDNEIDPGRGSFFSVSAEWASKVLGSEVGYVQPAVEFRKYGALPGKMVLAGRIRYETIQDTEDTETIPINRRLFLGGTNTVRGYGYQKLGPLDITGTPVGGQSAVNGNIELRYPIFQKISGVFFLDMGFVDVDPFTLNTDELRFTGGAGLRYNTPIGPLRIDFGYKLNPPTLGDVAVADVPNPEDDIEDRWKIHFSIGHTF